MTNFLFATTAILALVASPAAAQQAADENASDNNAIVVTASRSGDAVPLDQIGGSVTLIDDAALTRRQVRDVADVLRDVPGVAVGKVPGQTQVRLRGAEGNHTLVLVDGIEVSDPFTGEFDFGTLIADEAARIEVLRGQQSALYGSDAIGGVIHYITLSGREAPGLRARVEAGSFGTVNAAARVAGVAGALDYALSASLTSTDGVPNARDGDRDLANDSRAVSLKSTWSPAANARLTAVARYSRTKADFNGSDFNPSSPTFGYTIDTPGSRFDNRAAYGLLRGEVDLLDGRWSHALTGQVADTERDGFDASGPAYGDEGRRLKGSYETTLRINAGALRHRLTFALDAERERYRNTDPSGFAFTGRRKTANVGIVGQYDLAIGERAAIGASLRHDANDRFDDTTTYRVQGSYRVAPATRLRGAIGSGVKNPGFYELFGYIDGRYIGNPNLRPERSKGWEVGLEQEFLDKAVLIGATYFSSRLEDEIFTDFPPPTFVATPGNRDTKSKQRGIEAFARARLGEAWRIDAAYTYLHARENGVEEVRRPRHIASVAVDWRAPGDGGGLNLVARYNGTARDLAFTDPSFIPVRVKLDDYVLVNLAGDIAIDRRFALFGRVENLLDADYEDVFSFATAGRAAFAGIRARF